MTTTVLGERVPQRSWWYGVHHMRHRTNMAMFITGELLCNQTTMTGNVTEKRHVGGWLPSCRSPSVSCSFISIPNNTDKATTASRPHKENLKISAIIAHQDCNSRGSWLCGGHHLTIQCMCGNVHYRTSVAKNKKQWKKPHHVNSDFWNGTLNDHCGTVFITKPNTNITMIVTGTSVQILSGEVLSLVNQDLWHLPAAIMVICCVGTIPCKCGYDDPWIIPQTRHSQTRHYVNQDFCAICSYPWKRHGVHHGTMHANTSERLSHHAK